MQVKNQELYAITLPGILSSSDSFNQLCTQVKVRDHDQPLEMIGHFPGFGCCKFPGESDLKSSFYLKQLKSNYFSNCI